MRIKISDKGLVAAPILLILIAMIIAALFSCNAYKGIEKNAPVTSKDSSRLAARSLKTFPPKKSEIKQGKTIIIKDTSKLAQLRKTADSLKHIVDSVRNIKTPQTKDTLCNKLINESFDNGYNLGIKVGRYDGLQDCEASTERIDTVFQIPHETVVELFDKNVKLKAATADNEKKDKTISEQKSKLSNRTIIILSLIIALLLSGGGNYLQYRNSKLKKLIK